MKKITIIAFFAALGMISCNDKKAEATTTTETPTTETTPVDPHAGHNHAPGEGHDHDAPATNTATQATTANTAAGMNPPHGQPGHRCDIPVGAPLNSPPGQGAQQQATQSTAPKTNGGGFLGSGNTQAAPQQAAPQQQAMPAQQTAPGMQGKPNPAHGQPGHRCDIAVGQPLP